jgi:hypothetical protein
MRSGEAEASRDHRGQEEKGEAVATPEDLDKGRERR